jgi:DNA repair exonuclease SbcCD nuclease subunit
MMKIAITADVHLTSYDRHPERYRALENIMDQLVEQNIEKLIIAGDLFDTSCNNPGEFEKLVGQKKFNQLEIYIIPGNHDPALSVGSFSLKNIKYLTEPEPIAFSEDVSFLFLPYRPSTTVGEALAAIQEHVPDKNWVLIAHGDYQSSTTLRNEYEQGFYMPLSRRDIERYQPLKALLGHIHLPYNSDTLYYPGSPCGLDITETGHRSFLIYNTAKNTVTRHTIETDVIYFQVRLTVLPLEDEIGYVRTKLTQAVSGWGVKEQHRERLKVRISVQGYSSNREAIAQTVTDFFSQERIHLIDPPDLGKLKISTDVTRADIVSAAQERLASLGLPDGVDEPSIDDYILSAMNQVYGG